MIDVKFPLEATCICRLTEKTAARPFARSVVRDEYGVILDLRFDQIPQILGSGPMGKRLDLIVETIVGMDMAALRRLEWALRDDQG